MAVALDLLQLTASGPAQLRAENSGERGWAGSIQLGYPDFALVLRFPVPATTFL
jgi:hypothetical protein